MKAVFISDAHLDGSDSEGYYCLSRFLDSLRGNTDELFIVGDFFDFWFAGRNGIYPSFIDIVRKLLEIKESGTKISFFEGNHDFFLGDYFEQYGVMVFPDDASIDLEGKRVLVSHGDAVDTSNTAYLALRKVLRSRLFYSFQKNMPPQALWTISKIVSRISRASGCEPQSSNRLAAVMSAFAAGKFEEGFDAVVLGHCHTPSMERYSVNGKAKTFVILGDWITRYSYLVYEGGEFMMKRYYCKK